MKHVGIIGFPVAHSLSPRMQQAAFDACGIAARYAHWETAPENLPARIASLRAPEMLGANVTIPHKTAALALIDACDPLAARVGAINTIVNRNGRLMGYNTDVGGFMQALATNQNHPFHSQGKRAIIIGTGGAARAAAVGLLEGGVAELTLLGRAETHLTALLQHLQASVAPASERLGEKPRLKTPLEGHRPTKPSCGGPPPQLTQGGSVDAVVHPQASSGESINLHAALLNSPSAHRLLAQADLLVNATPVGLHENDHRLLVDVHLLPSTALVMDMIFHPPCTPLLRAAQARGCPVLNGLTMLLHQGALAFEHWTGRPAPVEAMQRALGLP